MGGSDPLLDLLDEARADAAGSARSRQRWLEQQAAEGATLVGTLVGLAERGSPVALRTRAGRVCHGPLVAVSDDFVVVRADAGRDHCVRLGSVASVGVQPGARPPVPSDDRPAPLDLRLVEVLAGLAPERPRLALVTAGELVSGVLLAVGIDVVTLGHESDRRLAVYVAAEAIEEAVIEWG